jgi:L-histidine N-alpha-methyltransferase
LIGFDLLKDPEVLRAAYDDAEGVTAAFNLNLLTRMNRELGADFDPSSFRHYACLDPRRSAMDSYLVHARSARARWRRKHTVCRLGSGADGGVVQVPRS